MNEIKKFTEGSKNPFHLFRTLEYKLRFAADNPDYFYPAGIWVFCGPQGSGKTLSLVQTLKEMLKEYPKAKVISNLHIEGVEYTPFTDYKQIENESNGIYGLIFVIDEIHTLWNSLESKDIPISEISTFCQMRKDRRVILGTAQKRSRIAKPIREQLQYIIDCHCYFEIIQRNFVLEPTGEAENGDTVDADIICQQFWFHRPELYSSYDTLFKIKKPEREKKTKSKRGEMENAESSC